MQSKFKSLIVLIFCCFCALMANAESKTQIDSLKCLLSTNLSDSSYIIVLNKLSKASRHSNQIEAMDYAVKAEKLSENTTNQQGLALAYHNIGAIYADKSNNELALEYHLKSLRISELIKDKQATANSYGNIGLIYRRNRNYKKAIEYHTKSLNIKRELADTIGIAYSYGNLGLIYSAEGKYDKALIQFYNSLRLKESLNDKYGMANSYGNIGIIYFNIESFDQSKVNLERGLDIFKEINNQTGIAITLLYLGDIYFKQGFTNQAIEAFNQCLNIYTKKTNIKGMADSHIRLGNIYQSLGKNTIAEQDYKKGLEYYQKIKNNEGIVKAKIALAKYHLKNSKYTQAKTGLEIALRLSEKENLINEQNEILSLLAKLHLTLSNYKVAAQYLSDSKIISDYIFKQRLTKEIAQIEMQYEFDKLTQEREFKKKNSQLLQKQKTKRLRQFRNLFIACLILLSFFGLFGFRIIKALNKKNQLLQNQKLTISDHLSNLKIQKQELEQANHTKDKFLSIIGHDLRNPINAINSFVAMVNEYGDKMDDAMIKKYLRLIKEAGASAQSLLENLLEWSLSQTGEMKTKIENVSLNYIIKGNTLLVKEAAEKKDINININLDKNPIVSIDKNMINTVIRNLISNALKFTPKGGHVNIITKVNNGLVEIIIKDTGIGMSREQIHDLFVPGKVKKSIDGMSSSGLGLILCKDFLRKHNQELKVESMVNMGSKFWFTLPTIKL